MFIISRSVADLYKVICFAAGKKEKRKDVYK